MAGAIGFQFKLSMSLTKRIGKLEAQIERQGVELKAYRNCTATECPARILYAALTRPATVTLNSKPLSQ